MLAYCIPVDVTNEYVKIGESIADEYFKRFCHAIVRYLWKDILDHQ